MKQNSNPLSLFRGLAMWGAAIAITAPLSASIFITEVVDATLPGAAPKYIEITNGGAADYTFGAGGGIIVLSNGGDSLEVDVDMGGLTIAAGDTVTVSTNSGTQDITFEEVYGFAPDYLSDGASFGNGDDAYALVDNETAAAAGTFLDIFGIYLVDGTGTEWEYTDSYAYRNADITAGNGGTFNLAEWTLGGVDALQSENQTDEEETVLILALTTPGVFGESTGGDTWAGYDVTEGWTDTGAWLGLVYVTEAPWVYSDALMQWLYIDEGTVSMDGGWTFVVN